MKKLAIYGAGGFGRETLTLIREINLEHPKWDITGFYDDTIAQGSIINDVPVLGNIDSLNAVHEEIYLVAAIGDTLSKKNLIGKITNHHVKFATLIHPKVVVNDFQQVQIGKGSIIANGTIFTVDTVIGDHVIVNLSCTIGHDVNIGDFSSLMPGCHVSGNVRINEGVYIGTGAVLINNLTIGEYATVGAGAVVIKDIPAHKIAVGVPAKER